MTEGRKTSNFHNVFNTNDPIWSDWTSFTQGYTTKGTPRSSLVLKPCAPSIRAKEPDDTYGLKCGQIIEPSVRETRLDRYTHTSMFRSILMYDG